MRFSKQSFLPRSGFTLVELMVSVAILLLITASVISDIQRGRQQEELASSLRLVQGALRDAQADALAAVSVKTCTVSSNNVVCEHDDSLCGAAVCNQDTSPSAFGLVFQTGTSTFSFFADVFASDLDEDASGRERLELLRLARPKSDADTVTIDSLTADSSSVTEATVTFDRQSGNMRINPCLSAPCTPDEANILEIVLTHSLTEISKTVYLNAITGRISIQ